MSNTLSHTNGESWKTYWDKIEKPEREKVQVRIIFCDDKLVEPVGYNMF
jgi:hypothetical protein